MASIAVIPFEKAQGGMMAIYNDLNARRGKLAAVHTIQNLRTESIVKPMVLAHGVCFEADAGIGYAS